MGLTPEQLEETYSRLKNDIIVFTSAVSEDESKDHLAHLKEVYAKHIKSVRKLDAANSVADLIRLLEKRLVLGWFKVDLLKDILAAYDMMDGDSCDRYIEYVTELDKYRLKNKHVFSSYPYDPSLLTEIPTNKEVIPEDIVQHICTKMKDNYKEFGWELVADGFVKEGQLDRLIESDIPETEKVQQLLDLFVKGDKRTKRSQLSNILKKVDPGVSEQVDEMFMDSYY